jgi:periplasmic divalent cation tolerance protein
MDMAEVIRRRRTESGPSQADVAKAASVDTRQIRRYEAGQQQPVLSVAVAIANALGISVSELAGAPSHRVDWLVEFTRQLVIDRLCASGHNFAPIRTIYRWHGQVHDKTEGRIALRTRRSLLPQIIDRAKREHPYEVPSVVAVPIIDGGPDCIGGLRLDSGAGQALIQLQVPD